MYDISVVEAASRLGGGSSVELLERWECGRRQAAQLFGRAHRFVHFTSADDAELIVSSGVLELSSMIDCAVYAVAVGGVDSPRSQQGVSVSGFGRVAGLREHAVVFSCPVLPDCFWPDEVIWHRAAPLPILDAVVVARDDARYLLDGSLRFPPEWM